MKGGVCAACGRPPVAAKGVQRTWYWCLQHNGWHREACPWNESKQCCEAKTGLVLLRR